MTEKLAFCARDILVLGPLLTEGIWDGFSVKEPYEVKRV